MTHHKIINAMYKYKLVKKANPKDRDGEKKWYANPLSEQPLSFRQMTRAATANTTTSPIEMEGSFHLFGTYAIRQLVQGHTVKVGELGTFRVTFKSEGVDDIRKFNPITMIKEARILFTPSKEFREAVMKQLQFHNGGVLEEGVNYASVVDYCKAKGIDPSGSGSTAGGGSGEGDGGESPDPIV